MEYANQVATLLPLPLPLAYYHYPLPGGTQWPKSLNDATRGRRQQWMTNGHLHVVYRVHSRVAGQWHTIAQQVSRPPADVVNDTPHIHTQGLPGICTLKLL